MEPDQGAKVFAKIVVGVLIGFVAGFVNARGRLWSKKTETVSEILLFIVGVAFIGSSFTSGAVFGVMAIVEIAVGLYAYSKVFRSIKASS